MHKIIWCFPLVLLGCANCPKDPTQAEFFCGIRNLTTGTYQHREKVLQQEAVEAEARAQQYGSHAFALQEQATRLATQRNELRASLAAIKVDLDKDKQRLLQAKHERLTDQQTLTQLETQVQALQAKRERLANSSDLVLPEEVARLRQGNQQLKARINEILALPRAE